jgi:phosphoribosylpyrophosphate synthetase
MLIGIPEIKKIITTDTVAIPPEKMSFHSYAAVAVPSKKRARKWSKPEKLEILSVSGVFAQAIKRSYFRSSIGKLFEHEKD